ncbi:ABC transporter ATP-binding protein [Frankia gtarii]|uniref:ABC transporter ATP-binding protein n=1 Tax=Frankia gtarii TaxID=2950102 RepID=UPI0021BEC227|nr:ABC transporter ATP-binding protein [Frankia gtarii]
MTAPGVAAPAAPPVSSAAALTARGVTVKFGGLTALSEISVTVPHGAIVGLVGPNGAGKSTLFAVLSGLLRPNAGSVHLAGRDVTGASPQARARLGLARTFQQPELFMGLTVREHFALAHRMRHCRSRVWTDLFLGGSLRRCDPAERERVDALLEMLSLTPLADKEVDSLPLGTSRLVEVGRALATAPSVMLLDEPLSGLDAHEAERLAGTLRQVAAEEKVSMLLVEHDVAIVLSLSSRIFVLDFGVLIAEGTPNEIRADARVRDAYLGDEGSGEETLADAVVDATAGRDRAAGDPSGGGAAADGDTTDLVRIAGEGADRE